MAVPFVTALGAVASGTGAINPALPVGFQPGHIHILFVETGNEPLAAISGWSNAGAGFVQQGGGLVTGLHILWRRAQAGDTAPAVPDSGDHQIARVLGIGGAVTSGDPWDQPTFTTENVADTSVATPQITTTVPETLVIGAVSTGQDTTTGQITGSWINGSLTGIVGQMNNWTNAGNGGGFGVMTGAKTTAGLVSACQATLAVANFKALFTGAIKPAAGGGTVVVWPPKRRGPNYRR